MTEKTNELTVNVGTTINGKSPEEFTKQIDDLIGKLKEAKSLLEELTSEMTSLEKNEKIQIGKTAVDFINSLERINGTDYLSTGDKGEECR